MNKETNTSTSPYDLNALAEQRLRTKNPLVVPYQVDRPYEPRPWWLELDGKEVAR